MNNIGNGKKIKRNFKEVTTRKRCKFCGNYLVMLYGNFDYFVSNDLNAKTRSKNYINHSKVIARRAVTISNRRSLKAKSSTMCIEKHSFAFKSNFVFTCETKDCKPYTSFHKILREANFLSPTKAEHSDTTSFPEINARKIKY